MNTRFPMLVKIYVNDEHLKMTFTLLVLYLHENFI